MFQAIVDLICMLGFLGVSAAVKDSYQSRKGIDQNIIFHSYYRVFQEVNFYFDTMQNWVKCFKRVSIGYDGSVSTVYFRHPKKHTFAHSIACAIWTSPTTIQAPMAGQTMLIERKFDAHVYIEVIYMCRLCLRIVSETPIVEELMQTVINTGTSSAPIDPTDVVDFVEQLTRRAAMVASNPYCIGLFV